MSDIGVLVMTFDGYADIWPLCAQLFNRFWPDREWPMYWMSNGAAVPDIATPLVVPGTPRTQWSKPVEMAVRLMPEPYVLAWHEEILPLSPIPNDLFQEGAEILRTTPDVGIVQLTRYYFRTPNPTIGTFGDYPREAAGFSSAMPAIFRKEILLHLLKELVQSNYFEQQGADVMRRDLPNVRVMTSSKPMFKLCDNALLAGPWRACAVKHLTELGFTIDYSKRGIAPVASDHMEGIPA